MFIKHCLTAILTLSVKNYRVLVKSCNVLALTQTGEVQAIMTHGNVRLCTRAVANGQAFRLSAATYRFWSFLMLTIFCLWQSVILVKSVT